VVEKTALAEAEVEYHDHVSDWIHVRFAHVAGGGPAAGAAIVIWTTTPWTMPGNRAIAYAEEADYVRLRVEAVTEGSRAKVGEELVVAAALLEAFAKDCAIARHAALATFKGRALAGTICRHPLRGQGYEFDVPLYPADFVTMDTGTGFVHIAPGHGADDFELGMTHGIKPPETVDEEGRFIAAVPLFAGKRVYTAYGKRGDANDAVIGALDAAGGLLATGKLTHQYPCSWRSKAPLIFRNTPQWFISMDANDLRKKALASIDRDVRWVPASGRNRIYSMIEQRPDWVVSRQRAWGVPLTLFVDKRTNAPLKDARVNERIAAAFEQEGVDAWFAEGAAARFLRPEHDPAHFDKIDDIVEVWFDSGSTHAFVLEARPDLVWPASLYLEGSDQHRGWFHSSLLEACGTRGRAPYEAVLTHGFVLDGEGRKMSKSLGNTVAPQQICDKYGADILRLWTVTSDYTEDLRISMPIVEAQAETYRRLRNTLRYVLGNLADFRESERLAPAEMPSLERWVLHRIAELDALLRQTVEDFAFQTFYTQLHAFCASDLSAFYFDIRKDALYCDPPTSKRRRAARTVLDHLFHCLTAWLAPALVFTAEEAWLARFPGEAESVHLRTFPEIPKTWLNDALGADWAKVRELRGAVTAAMEIDRAAKKIGASLQAKIRATAAPEQAAAIRALGLGPADLAEIAIVSAFELREGETSAVEVHLAEGQKCARCWQVLPEVGKAKKPDLCLRCDDAVAKA
jgi:isoleucyl-tRNA synthetase